MKTACRHTVVFLVVVAAFAAAPALVVYAFGPKVKHSGVCRFCGRGHYEVWRLGIKTSDDIAENDSSAWVDSIRPGHTQHVWTVTSTDRRNWFGPGPAGTGGGNVVAEIYLARNQIGEAKARELLAKYHATSEVGWASARDFLLSELLPLLTNQNESVRSP